jgi:subtilisin family serine protease
MKMKSKGNTSKVSQSDLDARIFRAAPARIEFAVDTARELFSPPAAEGIDFDLFAGFADVSFPSLWAITKGHGVRIAVLDTGVALHPALEPNINRAASKDFTGSSANSNDVTDEDGHGTHVAGIIAARADVGVAPEAELCIGKVSRTDSGGKVGDLLAGINWAIEQQVNIINISFGSHEEPSLEIHKAIKRAKDKHIFVICAAGNSGVAGLDYPAKYQECVAVGAIDLVQRRWEASQEASAVGDELDIVARGEKINSTLRDGRFGKLSGTSMAAPFVTGVLALALSKPLTPASRPIRTHEQLLERLKLTAKDLGPGGRDKEFGFGKIDPESLFNSI